MIFTRNSVNILLGWASTQPVFTQQDFLRYLDKNQFKYINENKLVDSNQVKTAIMDFEMVDKLNKLEENKLVKDQTGFVGAGHMARHDPDNFDRVSGQGEEHGV